MDWIFTEFGLDQTIKKIIRKRKTPGSVISGISPHLRIGNLLIRDWEILDGLFPSGIKLVTKIDPTEVNLPGDLKEIRRSIEAELKEKEAKGLVIPYNGRRYALVSCKFHRIDDSLESNTCFLRFKYSDYYNFLATSKALDRLIPGKKITVREKYYKGTDPANIRRDYLYHSFGVNLAVITSDQRLLVVKRSSKVDMLSGVYNSSMNEGVSRDLDQEVDRSVNIHKTAIRGLNEELGLAEDEIEELSFTSVGFSRKWFQHAVLGHVILKTTYEELKRRLILSKDGSFEIECLHKTDNNGKLMSEFAIYGVPFTPKNFSHFLLSNKATISSWGLCCFVLSFIATKKFTLSEVEKAFSDEYWKNESYLA